MTNEIDVSKHGERRSTVVGCRVAGYRSGMSFQSFEEIEAWQEARRFRQWLKGVCMRDVVKNDWTWIDQIRRSTLSIMANIAEGNDSGSNAQFVVFLGYAKSSASETRSHLFAALDDLYITQEEFTEWSGTLKSISARLSNLIRYLRNHKQGARQKFDQPVSVESDILQPATFNQPSPI